VVISRGKHHWSAWSTRTGMAWDMRHRWRQLHRRARPLQRRPGLHGQLPARSLDPTSAQVLRQPRHGRDGGRLESGRRPGKMPLWQRLGPIRSCGCTTSSGGRCPTGSGRGCCMTGRVGRGWCVSFCGGWSWSRPSPPACSPFSVVGSLVALGAGVDRVGFAGESSLFGVVCGGECRSPAGGARLPPRVRIDGAPRGVRRRPCGGGRAVSGCLSSDGGVTGSAIRDRLGVSRAAQPKERWATATGRAECLVVPTIPVRFRRRGGRR
jgi:hypothetical protein